MKSIRSNDNYGLISRSPARDERLRPDMKEPGARDRAGLFAFVGQR